ncbi:hypothetical protein HOC37_01855 [bacterium]|jgi:polysaccharide biosynthesis/export protein|nr:hypothetical protein [bacterium]MBT3581935.1 hypothetical protein [bacterium]MBT4551712.1 hypothetical protein [bacterium]MBT7088684.1 hypothetical protein [bacterium]
MKKIIFVLLLILGFSGILWANQVIEVGDTLSFYAVDDKQTDLILGSVVQDASSVVDKLHDRVVSSSGEVYLINIGIFKVVGRTIPEVEDLVLRKLKRHYKYVEVKVLLKNIRLNRIYVLGEVVKPGLYEIPGYDKIRNKLMNVINLAGGFKTQADLKNVLMMRKGGITHIADLYKLINKNDLSQNLSLEDGDTILVKRTFVSIYILGQVNKPGSYPYIPDANFMDYLSEAGGYTEKADTGNVGIVRRKKERVEVYRIRADLFNFNNDTLKFALQEGDIVFVPKHFFADWKDIGAFLGLARNTIYFYDMITN